MKIKKIKFIDSATTDEQSATPTRPLIIEAVGFLIDETDIYITIARELLGNEYRGQLSIPKVAIIKSKEEH